MRFLLSRLTSIAPLLPLLAGCATSLITPQSEQAWGAKMAQQVERQVGLYRDDELQGYVQAVGRRLTESLGESPYTFRFAIIDQPVPNAFASPGGYVYISRGLLALINSEAELAGVLAHEISHVTERHHTRQIGRQLGAGLLTLPGKAVGIVSEDLGAAINAPIETAEAVFLSSYSRSQESEADAVGMRLAARAGYDPAALVSALDNLERAMEALTGHEHEVSFFDSHPATPERIRAIEQVMASIEVRGREPLATRLALLQLLDGLWVGVQNPQQGLFEGETFRSVDLNLAFDFPDGWRTRNTPMYVAAEAPDAAGRAMLLTVPREEPIDDLADELLAAIRERSGATPTERRSLSIGGWPAEMLRFTSDDGPSPSQMIYLFVETDRAKLMMVADATGETASKAILDSAHSLRPLSDGERVAYRSERLRLYAARPGESLREATVASGSIWTASYAAAANGISANGEPEQGNVLKLARRE
ncbi:MAG: M48 family metalloprotease, partial [Halieaceae bacterium]|nr:M48 family metalloprotease [Halieaceae bacterium]